LNTQVNASVSTAVKNALSYKFPRSIGWLCIAGISSIAQPAHAQSGEAGILEEVVVTSRRYEERITDAPLAVAVMGVDFLRENRIESVQDILELTPGADWGGPFKAQPTLSVRGIPGNTFGNASLEQSVSIVADGMPLTKAYMSTIPVYDLQRVEILRGPQGTTFGRNATLGMIHTISARPSQVSSGSVEVTGGERGLFGINGHFNGALTDKLSGRIAYNYTDTPGAMEDEQGNKLEYAKTTALRGSLLFEPSDTFSAYVKAEYVKDEEFPATRRYNEQGVVWLNATFGSERSNSDPWRVDISPAPAGRPWIVERDMVLLTGELSWLLANDISVTSITGYQTGDHYTNSSAFGTAYDIRDQLVWNDGWVLSQEVRVDNQASGNRFRWLAGVSYLRDEEDRLEINESEPLRGNCAATAPNRTGCPRNNTLVTDALNETEALGIFGEVTFDITDQLTLAVGGRYSNDSRDMEFATFGYGDSSGLGGIGLGETNPARSCEAVINAYYANLAIPRPATIPLGLIDCGTPANPVGFEGVVGDSWNDFSSKVSLTYALNDNNNIYALYSEGFKAGGFQHDARSRPDLNVILDSEKATNIEIGWKGSYDRVVFAVTAFKQEQKDVHTPNLVVIGAAQANLIVNNPGIENTGFEFEATWAVTDSLTVGGNIAKYSPEYKAGSRLGSTFNTVTGGFVGGEDISGTVPVGSIEDSAYIFATYEWELSGGSNLSVRADLKHRGTVWAIDGAVARRALNLSGSGLLFERPELNKTGLRIDWTSPQEKWRVALFGRNLDNKPDFTNIGPGFAFVYLASPNEPTQRARAVGYTGRREVGASVGYSF
jgi:iron complex outermembrane receptor protein